jgi:transposase InsO family protein
VTEAAAIATHWREEYNDYRPHGSLKGLTPNMFLDQWRQENADTKKAA